MKKLVMALCLVFLLGISYIGAQEKDSPNQEKQIKELIAQLAGKDASKWEAAKTQLLDIGGPARPYLEQAAKDAANADVKSRLEKTLDRIPGPAARDMLIKSLANISQTKGYRFSAVLSASVSPDQPDAAPITMPPTKAEGFTKTGDFSYIKIIMKDNVEEITELYRKDSAIIFKKNTSETPDQWGKAKEDESVYMDDLISQPAGIDGFRTLFDLARFGNNEKCQGVDCRVIELPMKGKKLIELLPKGALKDFEDVKKVNMKYKVWVGKSDQIMYKASVAVDIETEITDPESQEKTAMRFSSYSDIKITDYNKEIKTEMPDEVRKLFD